MSQDDPRDFRKRLTDHIFNTKHDVQVIHEAVEKGDRSLIYQHDFRLAYLLGLQNALKIWDDYQADLRKIIEEARAEQESAECPETTD